MIQTQLLKADKPYQIISAAGMVGIQVATLIVTEDKIAKDGSYLIDTHSHPVVNYAVKDNLTEDLKYWDGDPDDEWKYTQRLQPEGAVWNKVEVRDVRVLGLVGAKNPSVDLERFVSLVPSIYTNSPLASSSTPLWGGKTDSSIRNLKWALDRVGIKCDTFTNRVSDHTIHENQDFTKPGYIPIYFEIEEIYENDCLVKVIIRDNKYSDFSAPFDEIAFTCFLNEDPKEFIHTVISCMRELDHQFIRGHKLIRFVCRNISEIKHSWNKLLEKTANQINDEWNKVYFNVF